MADLRLKVFPEGFDFHQYLGVAAEGGAVVLEKIAVESEQFYDSFLTAPLSPFEPFGME